MRRATESGFTLIEFLLGGLVLAIAITAILGAYIGQVTLNEHARNLSLAIQDANRVIEQMRQNTSSGCTQPVASIACATDWDAWLAANGGRSIGAGTTAHERIATACQNADGTANAGANENPVRVTVSVCWRHRNRTIGECTFSGSPGVLAASEGVAVPNDTNVIDSPAMLTTLITCRG